METQIFFFSFYPNLTNTPQVKYFLNIIMLWKHNHKSSLSRPFGLHGLNMCSNFFLYCSRYVFKKLIRLVEAVRVLKTPVENCKENQHVRSKQPFLIGFGLVSQTPMSQRDSLKVVWLNKKSWHSTCTELTKDFSFRLIRFDFMYSMFIRFILYLIFGT